jgi:acyl-CoA oxidase
MNHAYFKVNAANDRLIAGVNEGLTPKQSWDHYAGIFLAEAATAFTYMWIFKTFMLGVLAINNEDLKTVMNNLLCLYGIQKILDNASGYY